MGKVRFTFTPPGPIFGMGHYSRVMALAQTLDSSGRMPEAIHKSVNAACRNPTSLELTTVGDFQWEGRNSWWIFDLSESGEYLELQVALAKETAFRTLVVDHVHQIFNEVDIRIVPSPFPASSVGPEKRQFFGWEFVLSRFGRGSEFDMRWKKESGEGVVLTGGADSLNVLPVWLQALGDAKREKLTLDVVKGRFAETHIAGIPDLVNVLDGEHEYPESFSGYSLGLVVHGVSTFDLLVSGVPVVVVPNPRADHYKETQALSGMGIAIVEEDPREAARVFLEIMGDNDRLSELREKLAEVLEIRSSFNVGDFLRAQ